MVKSQIKLLIVFLLSSFLISFNANAHHKKNAEVTEIFWEKENVEKREAEENARRLYCSVNAKGKPAKEGDVSIDVKTMEITPVSDKIIITGWHETKARKIKKGSLISKNGILPLKSKKIDLNIYEETKLIDVLKLYCVQLKSDARPDVKKIDKTELAVFYKEIAAENRLFNKGDEPDYNLPLARSNIENILDKGITISNKDAVFYYPDFLIDEVKTINKKEADKVSNKNWIDKNKPPLLNDIKDKKKKFDDKIKNLKTERKKLSPSLENYKVEIKEAKINLEDTLDLVDTRNKEIKSLVKEIKSNKRKYLDENNLKEFTKRLKDLKGIKFETKYESYKILNDLLKRVKKSNSKKQFIGYTKITGSKVIGFQKEFENIRDQKLGSKIEDEIINSFKKDIINEINNIQEYIIVPLDKITNLDEELSEGLPIVRYAIYLVIFLIVLAVIIYIYFQSRKISALSKVTETAGRKFTDIEGKLKDTSERIKTAGRQSRGRSSGDTTTTPESVKEKPKTPEQIITDKFHDMVSDYNEAIDNFSNVAAFKQKWNGVALSRKERQDGTKTVLINSSRAFEKSEIWCVNFSDKYFAFPGSTVKSNMAAYMNLDFEKASRDFKGVFDISSGSSWGTEPSIVRRGGAGFVVERKGKLIFPG